MPNFVNLFQIEESTPVSDSANDYIIALLSVNDYSNPIKIFRPSIFTDIWHYVPFINEAIKRFRNPPCSVVNTEDKRTEMNNRIVKLVKIWRSKLPSN